MATQPRKLSSIDVRTLVDEIVQVIEDPLDSMLRRDFDFDELPPSAGHQLANEVCELAIHIRLKRGDLTEPQCEFFRQVHQCLEDSGAGANFDAKDYRQLFRDAAVGSPENYDYAPTDCLNLLREYDVQHNTNHSSRLKELFVTLSQSVLDLHSGDAELLEELLIVWDETVTAKRNPKRCFRADSPTLIDNVHSAVNLLVNPLTEELHAHGNIARRGQTAEHWLRFYLFVFLGGLIHLDARSHRKSIELLHDLAPSFGMHGKSASIRELRRLLNDDDFPETSPLEKPMLIALLENYDQDFDTNFAETARELLSQLANALFSTSESLSDSQATWLSQFKTTINAD